MNKAQTLANQLSTYLPTICVRQRGDASYYDPKSEKITRRIPDLRDLLE